jgi:uncharacterized protein (TIGR03032 family)
VTPDGQVALEHQPFCHAMGIAATGDRIYLGGETQLWRLENDLSPGQATLSGHDRFYLPRGCTITGFIDIHEVTLDAQSRPMFVNTLYSCLAVPSMRASFRPVWKPRFVNALLPEDRCHLNGVAMKEGRPKYVTAFADTDTSGGWRPQLRDGGVVIDVETNRVVAEGMSAPHSPRIVNGGVLVLDSGRGDLVRIDPEHGSREQMVFLPGFLRGLALCDRFALITVSRSRQSNFEMLDLQARLDAYGLTPRCELAIVDLMRGEIVEWLRFEGHVHELFDVAVLRGVRRPATAAPSSAEVRNRITFER